MGGDLSVSGAEGEGRRDRRKRERRARIYDAARRLFLAQGFDATTVEQIAATADIAPATFFNHFPSKRAVLNEMTREVFEFLGFAIEQQLKASGRTRERLARLAAEAANGIGQSRGLAREVLLELVRSTARPGDVPPYLERIHEPFAAVIAEGQVRGEVRTDLEPHYLAEMAVGMFNTAITNWISDPDYPVEERLRRTAAFISEAIEPRGAEGPALRPRASKSASQHSKRSNPMGIDLNVDYLEADAWDETMRDRMRWLRENDPVHWSERSRLWVVSKFEDVNYVSKNHQLFCSGGGVRPGSAVKLPLIDEDEPRHTQLRRLINRGFTPRMVKKLETTFRQIATETIDKVASRGECDFVDDISVPMPILLIAEMIGIRQEDRERFHRWSDDLIAGDGNRDNPEVMQRSGQALREYADYLKEIFEDRRKQPQDDLISILVGARDQGLIGENKYDTDVEVRPIDTSAIERLEETRDLADDELVMLMVLLLVAGNETTRNGISGGMSLLIENPGERQKLIDDPSLIPAAVEEMVRLVSPVQSFARHATEDSEIRGQKIRKGDIVLMLYPSANLDPDEFEDPEVFKIDRDPRHLGFGVGNHFCLGANLARMEMRVAFEELLRRLPDMKYADGGPEVRPSPLVHSYMHMWVRYTPEA
jgi:cytochrome P450 family 142 subfamily A polypeptide 1